MNNRSRWNGLVNSRVMVAMVLTPLLAFYGSETAAQAQTLLDPTSYATLGTLTAVSGDTVAINTTTGVITITGPGATTYTGVTQSQTGAAPISVFDFTSISIASGATVTVVGSDPLALLSRGTATIVPTINANGAAGSPVLGSTTAGTGVLGGGNGGDGAPTISTIISPVPATPGTSTFNSNGGNVVLAPDSTLGYQDGAGGGGGGAGGAGGAAGGNAVAAGPSTPLVGGGGGGGGAFRTVTTDGAQPGAGGGAGGGAIEIVSTGTLTVSSVTSRGGLGGGFTPVDSGLQYGGGGGGGTIVLSGSSLDVTGTVNAHGGTAINGTDAGGGGGGITALIGTPSWVLGTATTAAELGLTVTVNGGMGGGDVGVSGTAGIIDATTVGVTAPTGQTATFNGSTFTNVIPPQTQSGRTTPGITITLGSNLILNGGTLQFTGTGETFGPTSTFSITANSTIDTQSNNDTVSSAITGSGGFTKIGSGTLTLANANSYVGNTNLNAGTLVVGNPTALGTTGELVQAGGTTVETDNVNHIIGTGSGTGIGFNQSSGGTLVINLNGLPSAGTTSNDVLNVTGSATLGGSLQINYDASPPAPGHPETYTVITTTTGINGTPGAGYTLPALHDGALNLTITGFPADGGNDWDVTISSAQGAFSGISGLTPNQHNVASNIDQFAGTATGPAASLVASLDTVSVNPAALGAALNQLMPLNFARFTSSTAFNDTDFLVEQMDNYFAGQRGADGAFVASRGGIDYSGLTLNDPDTAQGLQQVRSRLLAWNPAPSTGLLSDSASSLLGGVDMRDAKAMSPSAQGPANLWNVFVAGDVILGQDFSDPETGLAHDDSTAGGVRIGADYMITPNFRIGALFDYNHTDATIDQQNSNATVDTYMPGVYASYADHGWFANAIATYGFSNYSQSRNVAIAGFNGTATSAPSGDEIIGNLDGGYDFHSGRWTFGPTAGLKYVHLDVNGYTETGLPGADLGVNNDEADSLRGRLGGRVSYVFQGAGVIFTPHLDANWQHEFLDQSRNITSQFDGVDAGTFEVTTQSSSRDSALVNVGLDTQINGALTVFANYTVQAGQDDYFGQAVQAGVKIGF